MGAIWILTYDGHFIDFPMCSEIQVISHSFYMVVHPNFTEVADYRAGNDD
jgi:hypothetical protein